MSGDGWGGWEEEEEEEEGEGGSKPTPRSPPKLPGGSNRGPPILERGLLVLSGSPLPKATSEESVAVSTAGTAASREPTSPPRPDSKSPQLTVSHSHSSPKPPGNVSSPATTPLPPATAPGAAGTGREEERGVSSAHATSPPIASSTPKTAGSGKTQVCTCVYHT